MRRVSHTGSELEVPVNYFVKHKSVEPVFAVKLVGQLLAESGFPESIFIEHLASACDFQVNAVIGIHVAHFVFNDICAVVNRIAVNVGIISVVAPFYRVENGYFVVAVDCRPIGFCCRAIGLRYGCGFLVLVGARAS